MCCIVHTINNFSGFATPLVASLISSIITAVITFTIFKKNYKANEIKRLDDMLNQMIDYSIQYPYLEDQTFIDGWCQIIGGLQDEKYLRYESYGIFVFNFIEQVCQFYHYEKQKIENYIHVKEIIITHSKWWHNPSGAYDNIEGYPEKFRKFINSYLN